MVTTNSKCGSVFKPHQVFTKIVIRNVPWQNMSNFISVVLEKFPVIFQQNLLIYGINDKKVSKVRRKEASKQSGK